MSVFMNAGVDRLEVRLNVEFVTNLQSMRKIYTKSKRVHQVKKTCIRRQANVSPNARDSENTLKSTKYEKSQGREKNLPYLF